MSVPPPNTLSYTGEVAVPFIRRTFPPTSDFNKFSVPTIWIDTLAKIAYILVSVDLGTAEWIEIGDFTGGFPITPYVVGPSGEAGYQTIQSALDDANANGGGAVWVQQGTYTENLTLYDQTYICAVPLISQGPSEGVVIIGTHTPPTSGHTQINGCYLQSATDIFNSSATGTTHIQTANCETACQNGYVFNLPNWTGIIEVYDCNPGPNAAPFAINDGGINNTGGAEIVVYNSGVGNGSNVMNISGEAIFGQAVSVGCPCTLSSSCALTSIGSLYNGTLTVSDSSTIISTNDSFFTGANAAITYSSSANSSFSNTTISSSNNPSITGSGSGSIAFNLINFLLNDQISSSLNFSATSSSDSFFKAQSSSGSSEDPYSLYSVNNSDSWSSGIDKSSSARYKVSYNNSGSADPSTSSEKLGISTAGAVTFNSAYTFPNADGTSGQILVTDGAGTLSFQTSTAGTTVTLQKFTANGTYTPTSGTQYAIVEVYGGGGGGGGSAAVGSAQNASGAGGGAGGYARSVLSAATIGASQTITIGAGGAGGTAGANNGSTGGTSSFGSLVVATGGVGGQGSIAGSLIATDGGTGGQGTTGDVLGTGGVGTGGIGFRNTEVICYSSGGSGANSPLGQGGLSSVRAGGQVAGQNAVGFASGGSGSSSSAGSGGSQPAIGGGDGAPGIIIITEFS